MVAMEQSEDKIIVATLRDEGPFVLEWLAYHHLIGFDRFVLFSNDCSDGTNRLLNALEATGIVEHHNNTKIKPKKGRRHTDPQRRAYRWASIMPSVRNAAYVMVLDADEFLAIKTGDGTLDDLLAVTGAFDALSATWRFFGNSNISQFKDTPLISQFQRAGKKDRPNAIRKWGVKTISRPAGVRHFGVHRPVLEEDIVEGRQPLIWLNGSGERIEDQMREEGWRVNRHSQGTDLVEVFHYALRSSESFLMKRRRGSANTKNDSRIDREYFALYNENDEDEPMLQKWVEPVRKLVDQWRAEHPRIAQVHDNSVKYHIREIAALKAALSESDPELLEMLGITESADA